MEIPFLFEDLDMQVVISERNVIMNFKVSVLCRSIRTVERMLFVSSSD